MKGYLFNFLFNVFLIFFVFKILLKLFSSPFPKTAIPAKWKFTIVICRQRFVKKYLIGWNFYHGIFFCAKKSHFFVKILFISLLYYSNTCLIITPQVVLWGILRWISTGTRRGSPSGFSFTLNWKRFHLLKPFTKAFSFTVNWMLKTMVVSLH